MDKTFPASRENLESILSWIRSLLEQTQLQPPERQKMEVALEEAIVNIITHSKPKVIHIQVRHTPGKQIEFDLADEGPPFNPLLHPIKDQKLPINKLKPGGKGLILIRRCTDALLYRREKNKNFLTLIKKMNPSQ